MSEIGGKICRSCGAPFRLMNSISEDRCEVCQGLYQGRGQHILPSTKYNVHHRPSGEDWVILGVNPDRDEVCAAGWPPSIGRLTDCANFVAVGPITEKEIEYRNKMFGSNWV